MKKHMIKGIANAIPFLFLPVAGLEPARCCQQQILSLPRLPFRHAGLFQRKLDYHNLRYQARVLTPSFHFERYSVKYIW